jgi:hypothetical protein
MKYTNSFIKSFFLAGSFLCLLSCSEENPKEVEKTSTQAEVKTAANPFPFYKDISVRPGLNFEVVSWGKGVDSLGGYLILMSDSAKNNFRSFSYEREGTLVDAWNMDLDNDGNPELYVQTLTDQKVNDLSVYEFSRNSLQKITFPGLSSKMKKIYGGNDKFVMKNGDLFRSFPIVNSDDTTQKAGATKLLQYKLSGNSFSVQEVED